MADVQARGKTCIKEHFTRAGLATQAAASGVEERDIMRQTRHKSATIMRRYIRQGTRWQNNAAGKVGL